MKIKVTNEDTQSMRPKLDIVITVMEILAMGVLIIMGLMYFNTKAGNDAWNDGYTKGYEAGLEEGRWESADRIIYKEYQEVPNA